MSRNLEKRKNSGQFLGGSGKERKIKISANFATISTMIHYSYCTYSLYSTPHDLDSREVFSFYMLSISTHNAATPSAKSRTVVLNKVDIV